MKDAKVKIFVGQLCPFHIVFVFNLDSLSIEASLMLKCYQSRFQSDLKCSQSRIPA
ncbi:hypothetical protein Sjap_007970 [Stephania japonica]|uniref:Uncharacterized protein n=1 Tax=Stephania japonica TaxID=461633 RepID=A0AAP0JNL8_9MAGN